MTTANSPHPPAPRPNWVSPVPLADLEETQKLAARLAAQLAAGDLLVLTGGLGAGKTTFTQALAEALGVKGQVSSPTFVLSRIHPAAESGPDLVHVDAYRTDAEGLESLDLPATQAGAVTVVEWGRGLVESELAGPGGSWLDLELNRIEATEAGTHTTGAQAPLRAETANEIITDFSESEEDLLGAPRTAVLRGYGPRWPRSLL